MGGSCLVGQRRMFVGSGHRPSRRESRRSRRFNRRLKAKVVNLLRLEFLHPVKSRQGLPITTVNWLGYCNPTENERTLIKMVKMVIQPDIKPSLEPSGWTPGKLLSFLWEHPGEITFIYLNADVVEECLAPIHFWLNDFDRELYVMVNEGEYILPTLYRWLKPKYPGQSHLFRCWWDIKLFKARPPKGVTAAPVPIHI